MLDNPLARWVLVAVTSIVLAVPASAADEPVGRTFHIGLTPVFLDNKVSFLEAWRRYLEARLDARVEFVQRQTYREITELIVAEKLDAAWVCGFPFVRNEAHMRLLAVPLYRDEPLYQSYLIVPSSDHTTKDITDLEGKIFAYSDPNSNSTVISVWSAGVIFHVSKSSMSTLRLRAPSSADARMPFTYRAK